LCRRAGRECAPPDGSAHPTERRRYGIEQKENVHEEDQELEAQEGEH
jgi:hypothetical protein